MRKKKYLLLALLLAMINISRAQQRVEYFLDIDPGYGKAQAIENVQVGSNQLTFDLSNAPAGAHVLHVRSQDEQGRWSALLSRPLYVCQMRGIAQIEYFFDNTDPGEGKAIQVPVTNPKSAEQAFAIDVNTLAEGDHTLSVRVKSFDGLWTEVSSEPFSIVKASDGIVSIIWTMPVGIHAKKGQCVVECPKDSNRGDCVVEAFDMAGHRIGTVSWPAGISSVSINTSAANAVLIKITDKLHHRQIVKRVLCQ